MKYLALIGLISFFGIAPKMRILEGNMKTLKGQTSFQIKFTYDGMIVGTNTREEEYIADKKKLWEGKEPGKGAAFEQQWFADRARLYEPAFIQNFERFARVKLNDSTATYTLIVKTQRTEAGWNTGVMSHPGKIDGELWIVESADNRKVIARVGFYEFSGSDAYGGDFEMTRRIKSAYLLAGRGLGEFLRKKSK
jgi:hypothetical protein